MRALSVAGMIGATLAMLGCSQSEPYRESLEDAPVRSYQNMEAHSSSNLRQPDQERSYSAESADPVPATEETRSRSGVTMANFRRLESGMSYEEVTGILGKEGEEISSSDIAGIHTVMYQWMGDTGWGANMNVMFQDDKLIQKAQFGLK